MARPTHQRRFAEQTARQPRAAKPASAAGRRTQAARKKGRRHVLLLWVFASFVMAVTLTAAPGLTLLLLAGLAPTFVAGMVDQGPNAGTRIYTIFCFNMAGLVPFITELFQTGMSFGSVTLMLKDIYTWFVVYGLSAMALVTIRFGPIAAAAVLQLAANERAAKLGRLRRKLLADWGTDLVTGGESQ